MNRSYIALKQGQYKSQKDVHISLKKLRMLLKVAVYHIEFALFWSFSYQRKKLVITILSKTDKKYFNGCAYHIQALFF